MIVQNDFAKPLIIFVLIILGGAVLLGGVLTNSTVFDSARNALAIQEAVKVSTNYEAKANATVTSLESELSVAKQQAQIAQSQLDELSRTQTRVDQRQEVVYARDLILSAVTIIAILTIIACIAFFVITRGRAMLKTAEAKAYVEQRRLLEVQAAVRTRQEQQSAIGNAHSGQGRSLKVESAEWKRPQSR